NTEFDRQHRGQDPPALEAGCGDQPLLRAERYHRVPSIDALVLHRQEAPSTAHGSGPPSSWGRQAAMASLVQGDHVCPPWGGAYPVTATPDCQPVAATQGVGQTGVVAAEQLSILRHHAVAARPVVMGPACASSACSAPSRTGPS